MTAEEGILREVKKRCFDVDCKNCNNTGFCKDAKHYITGRFQPIESMQDDFTQEMFEGFLLGNVHKYVRRYGKKDAKIKDAQKILQYAIWLVELLEGKTIDPRK